MSEDTRENAIVPVEITLTDGTFYTLWAPKWIERGAEWQAFMGDDSGVFVFRSPADLLAYIWSDGPNDLAEHPRWTVFNTRGDDRVVPLARDHYDLVELPAYLAESPEPPAVDSVANVFTLARSLASVGGAEAATTFFASHSVLANASRGAVHFKGHLSEWSAIGRAVLTNWEKALHSIDEAVIVKDVDAAESARAEASIAAAVEVAKVAREERRKAREEERANEDPYDSTPWAAAGIDPIKVSLQGKTVYTLRTYLDDQPVFLGRYGEIVTFNNKKSLVRWLAEHADHDLASLSTWEDLVARANTGGLEVSVHGDNVYSFNGLERDILSGTDEVDTDQLGRAYELLADAADWADDDSLNSYFLANPRMQDYISYMLGDNLTSGYTPSAPFNDHARSWHDLEDMLIKRFSRF